MSFPSNFTCYEWCVTKVAHYMYGQSQEIVVFVAFKYSPDVSSNVWSKSSLHLDFEYARSKGSGETVRKRKLG